MKISNKGKCKYQISNANANKFEPYVHCLLAKLELLLALFATSFLCTAKLEPLKSLHSSVRGMPALKRQALL